MSPKFSMREGLCPSAIARSGRKKYAVRTYIETELKKSLSEALPKLTGLHYHNILDPAWFGLLDFKALILEKPGGFRW